MYLEVHQGTYTSQARNKWYNRKIEIALRELEYALVQAMIVADKAYPQNELECIWKEILLYQFHDILPGSSITRVYNESLLRYGILLKRVNELINDAYLSIVGQNNSDLASDKVAVFNSLSWQRSEWIENNGKWAHPLPFAFAQYQFFLYHDLN